MKQLWKPKTIWKWKAADQKIFSEEKFYSCLRNLPIRNILLLSGDEDNFWMKIFCQRNKRGLKSREWSRTFDCHFLPILPCFRAGQSKENAGWVEPNWIAKLGEPGEPNSFRGSRFNFYHREELRRDGVQGRQINVQTGNTERTLGTTSGTRWDDA